MFKRELKAPGRSFFLFGPRQTGKTTWLRGLDLSRAWEVNLLLNDTYYRYLKQPSQFRMEAEEKIRNGIEWIVLDEVQRIPDLLNEVHHLIESTGTRFILSGSSARKLKRCGGNLLGGRLLLRHLYPFSVREYPALEQGNGFCLERALQWGTLPPLLGLEERDAVDTLRAYVEVYLREEIQMEALVRNLGGFTRFLDLSAAYCGEIVNFSSLAKECGLPHRTVQSYFEVLEDTLIAYRLPAWRESPTKRLVGHPKLFLFDNGVTNALCHRLSGPLDPVTRGRLFEQFFIQETRRRLDYQGNPSRLHYWRTNNGAEVDLVLERAGHPVLAVEFKSRPEVDRADLSGLRSFHEDYPMVPCLVVCTAPEPWVLDFAKVLPWRHYLDYLEKELPS
jgi:predicted AAA+ superfamily ATPase